MTKGVKFTDRHEQATPLNNKQIFASPYALKRSIQTKHRPVRHFAELLSHVRYTPAVLLASFMQWVDHRQKIFFIQAADGQLHIGDIHGMIIVGSKMPQTEDIRFVDAAKLVGRQYLSYSFHHHISRVIALAGEPYLGAIGQAFYIKNIGQIDLDVPLAYFYENEFH